MKELFDAITVLKARSSPENWDDVLRVQRAVDNMVLQLRDAGNELSCCDDVILSSGLAAGIADLREQRDRLQQQLAAARENRAAWQKEAGLTLDALNAAREAANSDARRLDFMAHHGVSLRCHPDRWYLIAPYHTGIPCVDNRERFATAREALDAALATLQRDRRP